MMVARVIPGSTDVSGGVFTMRAGPGYISLSIRPTAGSAVLSAA